MGFRKKDKKNVWIKEIIEWNSIAGYCLGKLLKKNKLAIIFDRAIKVPKIKDKISLKIILKLFIKWEYNNKTDRILVISRELKDFGINRDDDCLLVYIH